MKANNQKLKTLSIIILLLTILRILIDGYHSFMIAMADESILDITIKATTLNSYKRAFLKYGFNMLCSVIGIMVSNNKLHKNMAFNVGAISLIVCVTLQFYEFAILSFIISILPLLLYIYFAWKSEF